MFPSPPFLPTLTLMTFLHPSPSAAPPSPSDMRTWVLRFKWTADFDAAILTHAINCDIPRLIGTHGVKEAWNAVAKAFKTQLKDEYLIDSPDVTSDKVRRRIPVIIERVREFQKEKPDTGTGQKRPPYEESVMAAAVAFIEMRDTTTEEKEKDAKEKKEKRQAEEEEMLSAAVTTAATKKRPKRKKRESGGDNFEGVVELMLEQRQKELEQRKREWEQRQKELEEQQKERQMFMQLIAKLAKGNRDS